MKYLFAIAIIAVIGGIRFAMFRARKKRRRASSDSPHGTHMGKVSHGTEPRVTEEPLEKTRVRRSIDFGAHFGEVGMIATREITERVRSRFFRFGTLIVLIVIALAIVIPAVQENSNAPTPQVIGVVGKLSPSFEQIVHGVGTADKDKVHFVGEPSIQKAKTALVSGKLTFAIVDGNQVLLKEPATQSSSPADSTLVEVTAEYLGVEKAYKTAGLSPAQQADVASSKSVPINTLQGAPKRPPRTVPIIGIVLLFMLLTQYCGWILIGVMQEKSSRVVEVLLATVRPIQLLSGKVLGIGLVALGQAALALSFALVLAEAVGSNLVKGDQPWALLAELCWFVLGYAFYCWVYAAAGSTAERQDQVQTLALPLSIPILLGYILSIATLSSGNPDVFFKVLAYLPPTAPFCMSVLVGLGQATWWEFLGSVLISIAGTAGMAVFAARIYRRAVLRTGGRVHLRELLVRRIEES